jgi:hypothetical protein
MLGEFEFDGIEYIASGESRALVEHRVPGLAGNYFQDLGAVPNAIVISGSKYTDEARDEFLNGIREIFKKGEPASFVADILNATDITEVVIEDLQVAELHDPAGFQYTVTLHQYVRPPEPPAEGLFDTDILGDAMNVMGALDALDALSSLPNFADPTPPLRDALGQVTGATSGLEGVTASLNSLFG